MSFARLVVPQRWQTLSSNLAIGAATGFALTIAALVLVFDRGATRPGLPTPHELHLRGTIAPGDLLDRGGFMRPSLAH